MPQPTLFKKDTSGISANESINRNKLIEEHKQAQQTATRLPIENALTTEKFHPQTTHLAELAKTQLPQAIDALKTVDIEALELLANCESQITSLQQDMKNTLAAGHKILICGCGSAGRAAEVVNKELRTAFPDSRYLQQVISVLAGGDASLVTAAEGFEDKKDYGIRQLVAMGWQPGDLVIGLSASGSANFIHGILEYAANNSSHKPYFIYCNLDNEVAENLARTTLFQNKTLLNKINLVSTYVGPMGLAGSTRMQAATAQILSIGIPLLDAVYSLTINKQLNNWQVSIKSLAKILENTDLHLLAPFIEEEAKIYQRNERIYYQVSAPLGLTLLTETTERSPTFNLETFENMNDENKSSRSSLCRIIVANTETAKEAWQKILDREPTALEWENIPHTEFKRLLGYNLSKTIVQQRSAYLSSIKHHFFNIKLEKNELTLQLTDHQTTFNLGKIADLPQHLRGLLQQASIKMILNNHSTLVMGKLDLYISNLMTYVKPSNLKLINRSIRLAYELLLQYYPDKIQKIITDNTAKLELVNEITKTIYHKMLALTAGESIVLETATEIAKNHLKLPTTLLPTTSNITPEVEQETLKKETVPQFS